MKDDKIHKMYDNLQQQSLIDAVTVLLSDSKKVEFNDDKTKCTISGLSIPEEKFEKLLTNVNFQRIPNIDWPGHYEHDYKQYGMTNSVGHYAFFTPHLQEAIIDFSPS